jgi:soluble epoxide hydrolase / lipid-phosphate phosphatase
MALELFPDKSKSAKLADGTTYAYVRTPASDGKPTFLFLHGFPGGSYDWRRQIGPLSDLGYGVVAPDLLGYGGTDKPAEVTAYSIKRMSDHMAELAKQEKLDKVIVVSHDQ